MHSVRAEKKVQLCNASYDRTDDRSDCRPIGLSATAATAIAAVLTTLSTSLDIPHQIDVPHANPTFSSFMLAFGTILFSFGGSGTFPTIQQDMTKPQKFPFAVLYSYSCMLTALFVVQIGFVVVYRAFFDHCREFAVVYSVTSL